MPGYAPHIQSSLTQRLALTDTAAQDHSSTHGIPEVSQCRTDCLKCAACHSFLTLHGSRLADKDRAILPASPKVP